MKAILVSALVIAAAVWAGDGMAGMEMPGMEEENRPATGVAMESLWWPGLPMNREGSGTAWLTDAAPVAAIHGVSGGWATMLHYNVFARYTSQNLNAAGVRGGKAFDGPNWIMAAASRSAGERARFASRAMLSFDALTEGGDGYPLLFQTGESWEGKPLVDRQHPHDLFGELAFGYGLRVGDRGGAFFYAGWPGEPALGPPVYLHRPAASEIADAPLGHHWQDSTHITFGVVTCGAWVGPFKVDGSVFNGREPDEDRYNIDPPRLDSFAGRATWNPTPNLSSQISYGLLKQPEPSHPGHDVARTTASALYSRTNGPSGWDTTAVWGMNRSLPGGSSHAALLETGGRRGRWAVCARGEWVQKPAADLEIPKTGEGQLFGVTAFTAGFSFKVVSSPAAAFRFGASATAYRVPPGLTAFYGRTPLSAEVFVRVSPEYAMAHPTHKH